MLQPNDDIRNLDTGVVDVILHLDVPARCLKDAHKGVADRGISKMTDMRRFVWIDVGVFDDDLPIVRGKTAETAGPDRRRTVEIEVDVAGPGNFHPLDPVNLADLDHELFRNCP